MDVVETTDEEGGRGWGDTPDGKTDNGGIGGQFDAIVVFGGTDGSHSARNHCYIIDPEMVRSSYCRCKDQIISGKFALHLCDWLCFL